eukprot:6077049-Pyramimonas_sp.AAC.1
MARDEPRPEGDPTLLAFTHEGEHDRGGRASFVAQRDALPLAVHERVRRDEGWESLSRSVRRRVEAREHRSDWESD